MPEKIVKNLLIVTFPSAGLGRARMMQDKAILVNQLRNCEIVREYFDILVLPDRQFNSEIAGGHTFRVLTKDGIENSEIITTDFLNALESIVKTDSEITGDTNETLENETID